MKIFDVLNRAEEVLSENGNTNAFYEARSLLEYTLNNTKEWIMVHINDEIGEDKRIAFESLIEKRIKGIPLQYIIGSCGFLGNDFFVNENVLVPRADTEVWVEKVIEFSKVIRPAKILDLCTGSGCIAVSIKKKLEDTKVYAVDISESALEVARKNAAYNNVEIEFYKSYLFKELESIKFDIIVSNPPYIPDEEIKELSKEVLNEPYIALSGGEDGLDFYRKIINSSSEYLIDNGYLVLEFGYNQSEKVIELLSKNGFVILEIVKDYSDNIRAVISQRGKINE